MLKNANNDDDITFMQRARVKWIWSCRIDSVDVLGRSVLSAIMRAGRAVQNHLSTFFSIISQPKTVYRRILFAARSPSENPFPMHREQPPMYLVKNDYRHNRQYFNLILGRCPQPAGSSRTSNSFYKADPLAVSLSLKTSSLSTKLWLVYELNSISH